MPDTIYGGRDVERKKKAWFNRRTGVTTTSPGPMSASFYKALQRAIDKLTEAELSTLITSKRVPDSVYDKIIREVEREIHDIQKEQLAIFAFTGGLIQKGIASATGKVYPFSPQADYLKAFLSRNAAALIKYIDETTRRTVKQIILNKSFTDVQSRTVIMQNIRQQIPLIPQHTTAVSNTFVRERDSLLKRGFGRAEAEAKASKLAAKQSDRLLRWRAWNITRTELSKGWAFSTQSTMKDAQRLGLFGNKRLAKLWLTAQDERVCSICGPMDGTTVPIDDVFTVIDSATGRNVENLIEGKVGETAYIYAHMSCRCDGVYVLA